MDTIKNLNLEQEIDKSMKEKDFYYAAHFARESGDKSLLTKVLKAYSTRLAKGKEDGFSRWCGTSFFHFETKRLLEYTKEIGETAFNRELLEILLHRANTASVRYERVEIAEVVVELTKEDKTGELSDIARKDFKIKAEKALKGCYLVYADWLYSHLEDTSGQERVRQKAVKLIRKRPIYALDDTMDYIKNIGDKSIELQFYERCLEEERKSQKPHMHIAHYTEKIMQLKNELTQK